jgi:hypothetical protein
MTVHYFRKSKFSFLESAVTLFHDCWIWSFHSFGAEFCQLHHLPWIYRVFHKSSASPIKTSLRKMLLHLLCWISDVVTIGINNLFQSFDPVPKNPRDCVRSESAQSFVDDLKKLTNLADLSRKEFYFQPLKEKKVWWCDLRAKLWMDNAFEA